MSWLQKLFGRDHGFAVWGDTKDHPIQHTGAHTAEYAEQPRLRPTIYRQVSEPAPEPTEPFLCDSWPPDDVIIRARGLLEEESRRQPTRPPFKQAVPAVVLLTLAVLALAMKRQEPAGSVNAAEVSTSRVAPVPHSWRYAGPDHQVVRQLLTRVDGWSVPACDSCAGMDTPRVRVEPRCDRDGSVAAAVQYAWAAEAYAAVGRDDRALAAAEKMRRQLDNARSACIIASGRNATPPGSCATVAIWPCPV